MEIVDKVHMDLETNIQQNSNCRSLKYKILALYEREIANEVWMDLEKNLQQNLDHKRLKYEYFHCM